MANNQYVNKVIYNGNTLIDLTSDTVLENKVESGKVFYGANGNRLVGTYTELNATIYQNSDYPAKVLLEIPTEMATVSGTKLIFS